MDKFSNTKPIDNLCFEKKIRNPTLIPVQKTFFAIAWKIRKNGLNRGSTPAIIICCIKTEMTGRLVYFWTGFLSIYPLNPMQKFWI